MVTEKDIIEEKCKCGCGDRIVTCEICGFKVGYRHRNNHACIIKEKEK